MFITSFLSLTNLANIESLVTSEQKYYVAKIFMYFEPLTFAINWVFFNSVLTVVIKSAKSFALYILSLGVQLITKISHLRTIFLYIYTQKNYGTHVIKLDIAPVAFPLGQHLFISASNNMFYRHSQWDKRHTICVVNLMPQDTKIEFLNRSCLGSNLQSSGWVIFISAKAKFTISVHWLILKDENATQYGIYGTGNESYFFKIMRICGT